MIAYDFVRMLVSSYVTVVRLLHNHGCGRGNSQLRQEMQRS